MSKINSIIEDNCTINLIKMFFYNMIHMKMIKYHLIKQKLFKINYFYMNFDFKKYFYSIFTSLYHQNNI